MLQIPEIQSDGFHGEIYDAIWTMALALRQLQLEYNSKPVDPVTSRRQSLSDFNYARHEMAERLMKKIAGLRFQGASGLVSFAGADRIGTTAVFQIQSTQGILFYRLILRSLYRFQ